MKVSTIFMLILIPIVARSQVEVGIRSGLAFSKQQYGNICYSPVVPSIAPTKQYCRSFKLR